MRAVFQKQIPIRISSNRDRKTLTNLPRVKIFLIAFLQFLSACELYKVDQSPQPLLEPPTTFQVKIPQQENASVAPWWQAYKSKQLHQLVKESLSNNFSLRSAWAKLRQSEATWKNTSAQKGPELGLTTEAARSHDQDPSSAESSSTTANRFNLGLALSYEIDLWNRKDALALADGANYKSARADYENTALLLSGKVTELWIRAQEQRGLIDLLHEQIKLDHQLLDLIKVRAQVGQGTAADIYRQQQQLEATQGELPIARSNYRQILNNLAVLTGQLNSPLKPNEIANLLPELPPLPAVITPSALLESRPDLRVIKEQLVGSEYSLAAAITDRLPQVKFVVNYNFDAAYLTDLFKGFVVEALTSMGAPLYDNGQHSSLIEKQRAVSDELKNTYTHAFLVAMKDIENSIIAERSQVKLLKSLNKQVQLAKATLEQTKSRYRNGVNDYLQVTLAAHSLHDLEKKAIEEQRNLLLNRNQLYLALGGAWTKKLPEVEGAAW